MGIPNMSNSRAMWAQNSAQRYTQHLRGWKHFLPCEVGICSGRKSALYTNTDKETKTAVASQGTLTVRRTPVT